MAILKSLTKWLEQNKIKYEIIDHKTVYTAKDKSQTLKIDPKTVVKTLALKADKNYVLVSVPSNKNLDKQKLKKTLNAWLKKQDEKAVKSIDFAKEAWMKKTVGGDVGTTPPFGALYELPTLIDQSLLKQKFLIINAGDYNQSLKLSHAAFEKASGDFIKGSFAK